MIDPVLGRRYLREVLFMVPKGRPLAERVLKAQLDRLLGEETTVPEFRELLSWNVKRDYITSSENDDEDTREWELTAAGREKEAERL